MLTSEIAGFSLTTVSGGPSRQVLGMGTHSEFARLQHNLFRDSARRVVEILLTIGIENGDSQVCIYGTRSYRGFSCTSDLKFQDALAALLQML
jgi:hypothetical protein